MPDQIIEPHDLAGYSTEGGDVYDQDRDAFVLPPQRDPRPPVPPTPGRPATAQRRSRRGPILLAIVLVLAVLAALGGWYLGVARYTSTPGVINLSRAAAQVKLDRAGLSMDVTKESYSETVNKGYVVSTDPGPGDRVLEDGTVGAVISLGPERHKVPKVQGKILDDAQQDRSPTPSSGTARRSSGSTRRSPRVG